MSHNKPNKDNMLKSLASAVVPLAVIALLFMEMLNTPFYTDRELATAREKTVGYAAEGNFNEAYARFEALFDIAPDDQKVWGDYIIVLLWDQQQDRALELAEQHLDTNQAPLYVIHELFATYLQRGQPDKALELALNAMPRANSPGNYAMVRSRQLADAGALPQAQALIAQALAMEPGNQQLVAAELSLALLVNETVAERELRLQLAKYPDNSALQNIQAQTAVIKARNGEYADALKELGQLYKQKPYDTAIASDYLVILSWAGRHREAVAVYERLAGSELKDYASEGAAVSLLWSGRIDEADTIMSALVARHPDSQRYARGLALVRVAQDKHLGAINILQAYGQASEGDTLELLGYLYAQEDNAVSSAAYFNRAFALQSPAHRAYLPWFNAVEQAISEKGIKPYLSQLQTWLPESAPDPIIARYIVLLLKYDQDQAAQQLVSQYPFNSRPELAAEPSQYPQNKLNLPTLLSLRAARQQAADGEQEVLFYQEQGVEEEEEEEELSETEAVEAADNREPFAPQTAKNIPASTQSADNNRLAQQLEWEAKTARDRGELKQSIKLYRFGTQHYPGNRQLKLGLALSLSEAGKQQEASQILAQLIERYPANRQVLDAGIYHYRKYQLNAELMATLEKLMPISEGKARDRVLKSWVTVLLSKRVYPGNLEQLQALETIAPLYPDSARWWLTKALLVSRQGDCTAALEALGHVSPNRSDQGMLESAGFIARQCQDYTLAQSYYAAAVQRYPKDSTFIAAMALSITDDGDPQAALAYLDKYADPVRPQRDILFARAYSNDAAGNYTAAASDYQALLKKWPDDREAYSQYVMAVNRSGDSAEALRLAYQHDDWLSQKHWQRLHADEASIALRGADRADIDDDEKQRLINKALAQLDRNIAYLQAQDPVDEQQLSNARFDRVATYYIGGDMQTCIDEYQALGLTPAETPNYLLIMVADAYALKQQPDAAIVLLSEANQREPDDRRAQAALFYAYLDSEQYDRAADLIKKMQAEVDASATPAQTPWQNKLAAMFEAYRNHLATAQQQLEQWLLQTPDDNDLKIKLAAIYRWRGWPEKALPLYDEVLSDNPESIDALVGKNYALFNLREYQQVGNEVDTLIEQHPDNSQVRLMDSDWNLHNMRELDSRVTAGKSDGGTFANKELVLDTRLYSRPLASNYRVFGHSYYATAELPDGEGDVDINRLGIGGEYRSRHFTGTAELSEALDNTGDAGVTLAGSWLPDDYWTVSTMLQSYSLLVPIRALNQGIDGESADLAVQYRWNEGHNIRFAGSYVDFSDGNTRKALHVNHYHRIFENQHHTIALMEQVYWSENSKGDDVPYYNPDNDFSLGLVFLYDGILWRRYEKQFSHHLAVGLGNYDQENYGSSFTWDIEYSQRWVHSRFLEFSYGMLHRNRSYDGKDEEFNALFGRVNWRF